MSHCSSQLEAREILVHCDPVPSLPVPDLMLLIPAPPDLTIVMHVMTPPAFDLLFSPPDPM